MQFVADRAPNMHNDYGEKRVIYFVSKIRLGNDKHNWFQ